MKVIHSRNIKNFGYRLLTWAYGMFHKMEKKVLFSSFGGKQYSDNPRAISERLHEMYPDYKIVWFMKDTVDKFDVVPNYVHRVPMNASTIIRERATACCIVTNEDIKSDFYKRKGQLVIQTWHGDRGFKKVLYDVPKEQLPKPFTVYDNKITDYCIAASDFGVNQYRSAFRYEGEIIKVGMPRNDKLIHRDLDNEKKVRSIFKIDDNKKILIYAPTFRDNLIGSQTPTVDLRRIIDILNRGKSDWVCLIRAHSSSAGVDFECDGNIFIDVSDYPDMADLLSIGDFLITDYSSCAGDFILKEKGTILAMFDKEQYTKQCREFPFDFKKAGFITADSQEELEKIIIEYSEEDYMNNCRQLIKYFNIVETGNSSTFICNVINDRFTSI